MNFLMKLAQLVQKLAPLLALITALIEKIPKLKRKRYDMSDQSVLIEGVAENFVKLIDDFKRLISGEFAVQEVSDFSKSLGDAIASIIILEDSIEDTGEFVDELYAYLEEKYDFFDSLDKLVDFKKILGMTLGTAVEAIDQTIIKTAFKQLVLFLVGYTKSVKWR